VGGEEERPGVLLTRNILLISVKIQDYTPSSFEESSKAGEVLYCTPGPAESSATLLFISLVRQQAGVDYWCIGRPQYYQKLEILDQS